MSRNRWLAGFALLLLVALSWSLYALRGGPATEPVGEPRTAPGEQSAAPEPMPGPDPERIEVTSSAGGTVVLMRGRVVDAYGEPVANALVGAADRANPSRTRRDGTFVLTAAVGEPLHVLVIAPGHAPLVVAPTARRDAGDQDLGDLQLALGGGIRGRVVDASGNGIAAATVALQLVSAPSLPEGFDATPLLQDMQSDAAGGFRSGRLVAGTWRLAVTAAGHQAAQSGEVAVREGEVTTVDPLVLAIGHDLVGVVLGPADAPLSGAAVQLRVRQPRYRAVVNTDAEGRFGLTGVPPGNAQLTVTCAGFQRLERNDLDVATAGELQLRLAPGLSITGVVVAAADGSPVERFAVSCRRVGDAAPPQNGSMALQLQRQIEELRAAAAPEALVGSLQERLAAVQALGRTRAVVVPEDPGEIASHPGGELRIDGLESGTYAVGVLSPLHCYEEIAPVVVVAEAPPTSLRFELRAGPSVRGVVTGRADGRPRPGLLVQLLRELDADVADAARVPEQPRYPWFFGAPGPKGIVVITTRSDGAGAFAFANLTPGRYFVALRGDTIADLESAPFDLRHGEHDLQLRVGDRASLHGRIANVPPTLRAGCSVLVLGGHGTLRTVAAAADGSYRIEGLQPGGYLVRAFPSDATQYRRRLLGEVFPLHAGAVDRAKVPACDVTLADGERRVLDLVLDVPATGRIEGTAAVDGAAAAGALAVLRPLPGEAPGSGGLSLRGACDAAGRFTIEDVPAGNYTLVALGATRQELHSEAVAVTPATTTFLDLTLRSGGLRGRVVTNDDTPPGELRGYLWVLPGATGEPDDLYLHRRENRTHRVPIRDGTFEERHLTPGPAVVIVDLRGRARQVSRLQVPQGGVLAIDLPAGARR